MTFSRFFVNSSDFKIAILELKDPQEIHHLRNVLRLKVNDVVILFNGQGEEGVGRILSLEKDNIKIHIEKVTSEPRNKPVLILACAVPKKSKFETIIEKCTELGVDEIIPLKTQRTIISFKPEELSRKTSRYQNVAINAAKQSQRKTVPAIHPVTKFNDFLKNIEAGSYAFIPCLKENNPHVFDSFKKITAPEKIIFLIGPEGDFTPEEVEEAQKAGCLPVSLGKTVLKVDTAAITVVACANLFFRK